VNDVNEPPTNIMMSNNILEHGLSSGALVGKILVEDEDFGDNHSFDFDNNYSNDNELFFLSSDSLFIADTVNYYSQNSYSINIIVIDVGEMQITKEFTITVNEPDNMSPTGISISNKNVNENLEAPTFIGKFETIDPNETDIHIYTFVLGEGGDDNESFEIINDSLYSIGLLNYEVQNEYLIRIQTMDDGEASLTFEEAFIIQVENINDPPTDIILTDTTLNHSLSEGSFVAILSAIDEDEADTHTYSFNNASDNDNESFYLINDTLFTSDTVNYYTQNNYLISISATDTSETQITKEFILTVNEPGNLSPTDIVLSNEYIDENSETPTFIGKFETIDPNETDSHNYFLIEGVDDDDNESFEIVNDSLYSIEFFNYEEQSEYKIRIQTIDDGVGNLDYEEAFIITITDINDPPTEITLSDTTLDHGLSDGAFIATLNAVDEDVMDLHTFSFSVDNDNDNEFFSLADDTLFTADTVNYYSQNSYLISIVATDSSDTQLAKDFNLTVNDPDPMPPTDISLSNENIDENNETHAFIGIFESFDLNETDEHVYSLTEGNGDDDNESFEILDDSLYSIEAFNYEVQNEFEIRIKSTDDGVGNLTYEEPFIITIGDVNDAPVDILFTDSIFSENQEVNSLITNMQTVDEDVDDSHVYSIISEFGWEDHFLVQENSILSATTFDFESDTIFTIIIQTDDAGGLNYSENFNLEIITGIRVIEDPVQLKIFPNPFSDYTTIIFDKSMNKPFTIELYDISGILIRRIDKVTTQQYTFESNGLSSGIYFIKIISSRNYCGKLMVK